jgi:trehalose/maltose hydrolase-like predicted phosphorylase
MLLYLMGLTSETDYGADVLKKNWEYYAPRTDLTSGSFLGPAIQGLVAAAVGETEKAYEYVRLAALVDLEDNRGNAAEGIHAASCGNI